MTTFRKDLQPEVKRFEALVLREVTTLVPNARFERIGPLQFGPMIPKWSCWVIVETDAERDLLVANRWLQKRLSELAADRSVFAPDSFTFQSQETVNRDYSGSWFYAMR